jgi:Ca2+/H+ antiporter
MCLFSSMGVIWVCIYIFSALIKLMTHQAHIMQKHVGITERTVELIHKNGR